jgi:hypothetical protein
MPSNEDDLYMSNWKPFDQRVKLRNISFNYFGSCNVQRVKVVLGSTIIHIHANPHWLENWRTGWNFFGFERKQNSILKCTWKYRDSLKDDLRIIWVFSSRTGITCVLLSKPSGRMLPDLHISEVKTISP